ncbi:hypothetical protein BST36_11320 [Mycolicibacterium moriokaense]|nr:hypothetical protein BST36_11320 [Mycolicibacterium moriokaense]
MSGCLRTSAGWAIGVGGFAVAVGVIAGTGVAPAQPVPVDPVVPPIPGVVTGIVDAGGPMPASPPPPPRTRRHRLPNQPTCADIRS